jgi:hypothetical protein
MNLGSPSLLLASVCIPRRFERRSDLGLRGVDEVAQHLPADRGIAVKKPPNDRISLGHRGRSNRDRVLPEQRRVHHRTLARTRTSAFAAMRVV